MARTRAALGLTNIGLNSDNVPVSGDWTITAAGTSLTEFLLVFNGGNGGPIVPSEYVAYLIDPTADGLSGTFTSPFANDKNGNGTGISHVSLYGRVGIVPLPAGVLLLLTGLGGLGLLGWRRRRIAA